MEREEFVLDQEEEKVPGGLKQQVTVTQVFFDSWSRTNSSLSIQAQLSFCSICRVEGRVPMVELWKLDKQLRVGHSDTFWREQGTWVPYDKQRHSLA